MLYVALYVIILNNHFMIVNILKKKKNVYVEVIPALLKLYVALYAISYMSNYMSKYSTLV